MKTFVVDALIGFGLVFAAIVVVVVGSFGIAVLGD
jgi:hypothetical protein